MNHNYQSLSVNIQGGVARIIINHGEINLLDGILIKDLYKASQSIADNNEVKVLIYESSNPDFFVAHADVNMIMAVADTPTPDGKTPSMLQQLFELIRHMPKVTIGKIAGIARGGGSELLLAMDMRFASISKTRIGQPEVALGLIAGGGGCVRLPKLMGRARAMEVLLGCEDFDAELAERYGYINRALNDSDLDSFVERLAKRLASYPSHAITATKALVNEAESIQPEQFGREYLQFHACASQKGMKERMQQALIRGLQTYDKEIDDLAKVTDSLPHMK